MTSPGGGDGPAGPTPPSRATVLFGVLFATALAALFAAMAYAAIGQAILRHDLAERGVTVTAEVQDIRHPRGGGLNSAVRFSTADGAVTADLQSYHRTAIGPTPQVRYDPLDPHRVMLASDVEDAEQAVGGVVMSLGCLLVSLAAAWWVIRQGARSR